MLIFFKYHGARSISAGTDKENKGSPDIFIEFCVRVCVCTSGNLSPLQVQSAHRKIEPLNCSSPRERRAWVLLQAMSFATGILCVPMCVWLEAFFHYICTSEGWRICIYSFLGGLLNLYSHSFHHPCLQGCYHLYSQACVHTPEADASKASDGWISHCSGFYVCNSKQA